MRAKKFEDKGERKLLRRKIEQRKPVLNRDEEFCEKRKKMRERKHFKLWLRKDPPFHLEFFMLLFRASVGARFCHRIKYNNGEF